MKATNEFDSWMVLLAAGFIGITVAITFRLEWWMSGLFTAGLMIGGERMWFSLIPSESQPDSFLTNDVLIRTVIPLLIYGLGIGWLLMSNPTVVNIGIGVTVGSAPMAFLLYSVR